MSADKVILLGPAHSEIDPMLHALREAAPDPHPDVVPAPQPRVSIHDKQSSSGREVGLLFRVDGNPRRFQAGPSFLTYAMEGRADYDSSVIPRSVAVGVKAYFLLVTVTNANGAIAWNLREARTRFLPVIKNRMQPLPSGGMPPIFLVGVDGELRAQATRNMSLKELEQIKSWSTGEPIVAIPRDEMEQLANGMGVTAYKEVSFVTGEGLLDLLEVTAREIDAAASKPSSSNTLGLPPQGSLDETFFPSQTGLKQQEIDAKKRPGGRFKPVK